MKPLRQVTVWLATVLFPSPLLAQREDPDPDDGVFPLAGLAPEGWETDGAQTLWYEQDTGILQLFAALEPATGTPIKASVFSIFSEPPLFRSDIAQQDVPALSGSFDYFTPESLGVVRFSSALTDLDFGPVMRAGLDSDDILQAFSTSGQIAEGPLFLPQVDLVVSTFDRRRPAPPVREFEFPPVFIPNVRLPGDADRDGDFDQYDVIQAVSSDKYRTGLAATWGEGDWDGGESAPDEPPPLGDGVFDGTDFDASKATRTYRAGPYTDRTTDNRILSPIGCCGQQGDEITSIVYDAGTGELSVDSPLGAPVLSSMNIESAAGVFSGDEISGRLRETFYDFDDDHTIFKTNMGGAFIPEVGRDPYFGSLSFGNVAQSGLSEDFLLDDLSVSGSAKRVGILDAIDLVYLGTSTLLQAGDANRDLTFDQLDLVGVLQSGKYLTGQAATWGEGDWNGAPGGSVESPPAGDGIFNQLDVVAAQQAGLYLTGPYTAIQPNGQANDSQTSIVYDAATGELAVDAPAGVELTSINIDSASGIFTGAAAVNLGDSFDNDTDTNIFKATFGSSFGSLTFGNVTQTDLSEEFVLSDLTVIGALAGGGGLGDVDLIYVPEPSSASLLFVGVLGVIAWYSGNQIRVQRRITRNW